MINKEEKKYRIAYLCLQSTQEGHAPYAHVNEIVNGLRRRGMQVDLFEPVFAEKNRPRGLISRLWSCLAVQLKLIPRLSRYDALYMRSHNLAAPTALAAKVLRVPHVIEVNGPYGDLITMYPWTRPFGGIIKFIARRIRRNADAIIAVTPAMAEWCSRDCGNPRVHVVPNGANTAIFRPTARDPQAPAGPYAIFFGAFSPWQGIATMLAAVHLPEWPAGVRLVLAGDGTERSKVEAAAAASDKILYVGTKSYRDLPGFVAPASVGLCVKDDGGTHANTGWSPLKLYEMMAVGIPVIVTRLQGQFELVETVQAGTVIEPGAPLALAKAVADIVNNPAEAREMGKRGHEAVLREHSWDRRAQDTLDILLSVLKRAAVDA